jgi:hypothetical protein
MAKEVDENEYDAADGESRQEALMEVMSPSGNVVEMPRRVQEPKMSTDTRIPADAGTGETVTAPINPRRIFVSYEAQRKDGKKRRMFQKVLDGLADIRTLQEINIVLLQLKELEPNHEDIVLVNWKPLEG